MAIARAHGAISTFESEKEQAIEVATQLCYKKQIIQRIKSATSLQEIYTALAAGRMAL